MRFSENLRVVPEQASKTRTDEFRGAWMQGARFIQSALEREFAGAQQLPVGHKCGGALAHRGPHGCRIPSKATAADCFDLHVYKLLVELGSPGSFPSWVCYQVPREIVVRDTV